jgi:hypothetical protein
MRIAESMWTLVVTVVLGYMIDRLGLVDSHLIADEQIKLGASTSNFNVLRSSRAFFSSPLWSQHHWPHLADVGVRWR